MLEECFSDPHNLVICQQKYAVEINSVLCLTYAYLNFKFIKLFLIKKNIDQNRTYIFCIWTSGYLFIKNVVSYEIYGENWKFTNTFAHWLEMCFVLRFAIHIIIFKHLYINLPNYSLRTLETVELVLACWSC